MPKIVFPTKIEADTKALLIQAAQIRNISTNALAEELMLHGAQHIINQQKTENLAEKPEPVKIYPPIPQHKGIGATDDEMLEPL